MRIAVLLRRLLASPGTPAERPLGGCEEAALDTAAALAAFRAGAEIVALAAGPAELEDPALRAAVRRGATRLVRVFEPGIEAVDYLGTARILSAAVRHLGFDLVLAGDRSEDEGQGAVGPAVAEWLGVPHVTGVRSLELEGPADAAPEAALAARRDPGSLRTIRIALPAVLGIAAFPGEAPPPRAEDAGDPSIETLDLAALGIQLAELKHRDRCVGRLVPVRLTSNATVVADAVELIARLRDDRLIPLAGAAGAAPSASPPTAGATTTPPPSDPVGGGSEPPRVG